MRFSLDPYASSEDEEEESFASSSEENSTPSDFEEEDDEEEPHPLGFGKTRFGIRFSNLSMEDNHDDDDDGLDDYFQEENNYYTSPFKHSSMQNYTPNQYESSAAVALMQLQLATLSTTTGSRSQHYSSSSARIQSFPAVYSSGRVSQRTANAATVMHHTSLSIQNEEKDQHYDDDDFGWDQPTQNGESRIQQLLNAAFSGMSIKEPNKSKTASNHITTLEKDFTSAMDVSAEIQKIRDEEAQCLLALKRAVLFSTQDAEQERKRLQMQMDKDHMVRSSVILLLIYNINRASLIHLFLQHVIYRIFETT